MKFYKLAIVDIVRLFCNSKLVMALFVDVELWISILWIKDDVLFTLEPRISVLYSAAIRWQYNPVRNGLALLQLLLRWDAAALAFVLGFLKSAGVMYT